MFIERQEYQMANILSFFELPNNVVGGALIPIMNNATPLGSVTIRTQAGIPVILRGTIGWTAVRNATGSSRADILYRLWRGAPVTGTELYSTQDSAEAGRDRNKVTSVSQADTEFGGSQDVTYTLTAELVNDGAANVVGSLTFYAAMNP